MKGLLSAPDSGEGRDRNGLRLRTRRRVSVRHIKHLSFPSVLWVLGREESKNVLAQAVSGQSSVLQGLAQS